MVRVISDANLFDINTKHSWPSSALTPLVTPFCWLEEFKSPFGKDELLPVLAIKL